MISISQYKRILDKGLLLDHYLVLCNMRDKKEMPKSRRIDGFINLLNKKGYIQDEELTEKAYEIIDIHPVMIVEAGEVETPQFDFVGWASTLHSKCKEKIKSLTGRVQVMSKIKKTDKKGYRFIDGVDDFTQRLLMCIQKYKLKDMDHIERAILNHIETCYLSGDWFPLMKYYIHKQGEGSPLVTDMENGSEPIISDSKSTQKFV